MWFGWLSSHSFTLSEELPPRIPRLGWAIAFVVATAAMAFAFVTFKQSSDTQGRPSRLERYAKAPTFEFLAHDGTKLSSSDLAGKIWVANFIFTRCKGPCPMITSRMAELQQKLARSKSTDVKLISITVDPAYDTPEVLNAYASQVGADSATWKFLTGPKAQIENAVTKGFLQPLSEGKDDEPIHSSRFVIVDREGDIRSFPDGNDPEVVQRLLLDLGDLLRESPQKSP